jgi:hypothetical protein
MAKRRTASPPADLATRPPIDPTPLVPVTAGKPYQLGTPLAAHGPQIVSREVLDALILPALRDGVPPTVACSLATIPRPTFQDWLKRGAEDREKGVETTRAVLADSVEKAESEFIKSKLELLNSIGKDAKQWVSQAWLLERRFSKLFGQRQESNESGPRILIQIGSLDAPAHEAGRATARRVWPSVMTSDGGKEVRLLTTADSVPVVDAVTCDDAE